MAAGGTAGAPSGPLPLVGASCATDADCGGNGGVCATVDSGIWAPGGPAGGYCTAPCPLAGVQDECTIANPIAACAPIGTNGAGYCILTCQQGQPFNIATKCLGRSDLLCNQLGGCLPSCGSNDRCPAGTECDLYDGFCVPPPVASETQGQECNPSVDTFCPCASLDPVNPAELSTNGVCAGFCALGVPVACGFDAAPRDSVCLSGDIQGDGILDIGLCLSTCDCNDDCPTGAVCRPTDAAFLADTGRAGSCDAPSMSIVPDAGVTSEGIPICP
jgi:hypothetical protein